MNILDISMNLILNPKSIMLANRNNVIFINISHIFSFCSHTAINTKAGPTSDS